MESAHKPTIDLSPTRGTVRFRAQEHLSQQQIEKKLLEGKKLHDAMFKLEDIFADRHNLFLTLNAFRLEMQSLTSNNRSGIWQLRNNLEMKIEAVQNDDNKLAQEAEVVKGEIERIFDEIEKADDPRIKDLVERRRELQQRFDSHKCDGMGVIKNTCVEVDQLLREVTLQVLIEYTEHYWSTHSLKEFAPSVDFPHPGAFQAHPAYMDIKAVAEGSQRMAIVSKSSETDATDEIIASHNLSVMFVHSLGKKIVYDPDAVEDARHLASLLETRGNKSHNPEILYNYYMKLGMFLGQDEGAAKEFALRKARKKDENFIPEGEEMNEETEGAK